MEFVASMTHRADELKKIINLWKTSGDPRNPFSGQFSRHYLHDQT